ncbi:MAG: ribonuclease P protein component [Gammaproteobacteria bacterium]|nr:ribonuclease P protein component [Gammaproteobacteria bacterium]
MSADVVDKTFPARVRLLTGPEYARVLKAQTRVGDRHFVLYYLANNGEEARLGLAIAKKIARTSVSRNRFKRIVRESFRHRRHRLPKADVVAMVRNGALDADNAALFESLRKLWSRLADVCATRSST